MQITLRQALRLVCAFGGNDEDFTLVHQNAGEGPSDDGSPSPEGLYAYLTEHPEEGMIYLGPTQVDPDFTTSAGTVIAERLRQIDEEGFTSEHDDALQPGIVALCAAAYMLQAAAGLAHTPTLRELYANQAAGLWPGDEDDEFKPKSPPRDLERAIACGMAELERMRRASRRELNARWGAQPGEQGAPAANLDSPAP